MRFPDQLVRYFMACAESKTREGIAKMKKEKDKKIKWIKPRLEFLGNNQKTKGACTNGSGNVDGCDTGNVASNSCGGGNLPLSI